jgi:amino acid transporter
VPPDCLFSQLYIIVNLSIYMGEVYMRFISCMNSQICRKRWSNKLKPWFKIFGPFIILINFIIVYLIIFVYPNENPLYTIGLAGLLTFIFVLFGVYLMTDTWGFGDFASRAYENR